MSRFSLVLVGIGLLAGIVVGSAFVPPLAGSSALNGFGRYFHIPLWGPLLPESSAPTSSSTGGVPLYKPALEYETAVVAAVKRAAPAVVAITVSKNVPVLERCPVDPFGNLPPEFRQFLGDQFQFYGTCEKGTRLEEVGGGSGFVISRDGMILTNKHVVADAKASYTVFTNDGKKYDATVLARDPVQDLAVVKIDAVGLPTLALGDSDSLELGQTAIAIGNALGEYRNTVSVGVVSGLSRTVTASGADFGAETIQGVIQTDAAINPGNSGGPLLNLRGEVVGINTAVALGAQNVGFAIPVNRAKRAIDSVRATGEIQAAYLGVRYLAITPDVAKAQKLPVENGAILRGTSDGPAVEPGSPAAVAGLKAEDIIVKLNDTVIDTDHPLSLVINQFGVGETVRITVLRDGKEIVLSATLAKRPK